MQLTNSTRGIAAEPGQGRERMGGQFAGYIPANRAERFREALSEMSEAIRRLRTVLRQAVKSRKGAAAPALI